MVADNRVDCIEFYLFWIPQPEVASFDYGHTQSGGYQPPVEASSFDYGHGVSSENVDYSADNTVIDYSAYVDVSQPSSKRPPIVNISKCQCQN